MTEPSKPSSAALAERTPTPPDNYSANKYFDAPPKVRIVSVEHNGCIRKHHHEFVEMVYVSDGFTLHSAEGEMSILVTGDLFFVRQGETHSYINAFQTKIYNLIFDTRELGIIANELAILPGLADLFRQAKEEPIPPRAMRLIHVPIGERRGLESALREMRRERLKQDMGWDCALKAQLISFLVRYSRLYTMQWRSGSTALSDYHGYVYRVLRYIDEHYTEDLTMKELSVVAGISPDYLMRRFRSALYMTPTEYLRKYRVAKAMELLCITDLPVAEIARAAGFSDPSLFSRIFKASVGLPPASYRKNLSEEYQKNGQTSYFDPSPSHVLNDEEMKPYHLF